MAEVHLPRSLVALFPDAPRRLDIEATDMAALVVALDVRYPGMWDRLCEPGPRFREHINAFVDGERVTIEAQLAPGSVVHIIPAVSGGGGIDDAERVHAESVEAWHAWLAEHHERTDGVWLVAWKRHTDRPRMTYEDAVVEALAWGWIDSKAARIDDEREMLWYSPRRPGSDWSRSNKERVARLEAEGRLMPAGRAAIEHAKADGSWTRLDDAEDLVVPDDLAAAFAARPGALDHWDEFSRTVKRNTLAEIARAKRPETRQRRIEQTADLAARGERTFPAPPIERRDRAHP
jgi:uncharacterized protein YdeI (YjbR/CyaY-like superfamily)/molybdopterin converting factor small subunit